MPDVKSRHTSQPHLSDNALLQYWWLRTPHSRGILVCLRNQPLIRKLKLLRECLMEAKPGLVCFRFRGFVYLLESSFDIL